MCSQSRPSNPVLRRVLTIAATAALFAVTPLARAAAGSLTTIYSFCSQSECADGEDPHELIMASSGTLYGVAPEGGYGVGTIYELVPNAQKTKWTYHRLHDFCKAAPCKDGSEPLGHLVIDASGNLFGTAVSGGAHNGGVLFELKHSGNVWTYKVIHSFGSGSEGREPIGGLTYAGQYSGAPWDDVSPLYGVTQEGAAHNLGAVYVVTDRNTWSVDLIRAYTSSQRVNELIMDASGNLLGTAAKGGTNGYGLLYRLTQVNGAWKETTLHNFCADNGCPDGATPDGRLLIDAHGNLFGVATLGGAGGLGVVFERTAAGSYTVLYSFCALTNCTDGEEPLGELAMDASGNLFGTASGGGTQGESYGAVFKLAPNGSAWTESVVYDFCDLVGCLDGYDPTTGVIVDSSGNLLGVTRFGGAHGNYGAVFELEP